MIYATKEFWAGAVERAIKTGAQFALLVIGVGVTALGADGQTAEVVSAFTLEWTAIGGAFLGGAFVSVLTSLMAPQKVPVIPEGTGKHRAGV